RTYTRPALSRHATARSHCPVDDASPPAGAQTECRQHPQSKEQAMNYKLEVVAVPVSDVDTAKAFYERIGYHTDHDHRVNDHLRFVQITPPGSDCSIVIGDAVTSAAPGSAQRMQVVVDDIEAA